MMPNQETNQAVCIPVQEEFGSPPDLELMHDEELQPVIERITRQQEVTHAYAEHELQTGEAAARTIKALGCGACKLEGVCAVGNLLKGWVAEGQENREFMEQLDMLVSAPAWLTAARLNRAGLSAREVQQLSSDRTRLRKAIVTGELDVENLLGGVTNTLENVYRKDDIPPLRHMPGISDKKPLEAHEITTGEGYTYTVIDASDQLAFKGEPLTDSEYGVLTNKLLGRMSQEGTGGNPQIFYADNGPQRTIRKIGNATMFELKMSGKNRLYFTVESGTEGKTARIVILGAHGGDASTQRSFIDVATAVR